MMIAPRYQFLAALLPLLVGCGTAAAAPGLDALVRRLPADSLVMPLRRYENEAARPADAAAAAVLLGRLHYARGDYRPAAEAFSRAAARLEPARKGTARYWAAMSWLALGVSAQARAGFEELAQDDSSLRTEARFGAALAWELSRNPDRAFEILEPLAREARGEIAPAVLERTMALADRFQRGDVAAAARSRLFKEFPRSIEAARAGLLPPRSITAMVELGPFTNEPRSHAAADAARGEGFTRVQPLVRDAGGARTFVVRLEGFANAAEAQRAADRLRRNLGVPARVVTEP